MEVHVVIFPILIQIELDRYQLKKRLSGWVLIAFEKNYENKLKRLKSN